MKSIAFVLSVFLLAWVSLSAQESDSESKERIRYSNITEFGFITANPKGISLEATTVQGFSIDKTHHLGLGLGMGGNFYTRTIDDTYYGFRESYTETAPYMPMFLNYRLYFKPDKVFSPHVNIALGGLLDEDMKGGVYSAITMGFRAGKFSLSAGASLLAINRYTYEYVYEDYCDPSGNCYPLSYSVPKWKWNYPFGLVLKCGFSF